MLEYWAERHNSQYLILKYEDMKAVGLPNVVIAISIGAIYFPGVQKQNSSFGWSSFCVLVVVCSV